MSTAGREARFGSKKEGGGEGKTERETEEEEGHRGSSNYVDSIELGQGDR